MSATELNPNVEETRNNLTGVAFAAAQVTGFALAVKKFNTVPLSPEPAWYGDFKLKLILAQKQADEWMTRLSPMMFSKVPQSIIDYGNLFDAAMSEVHRIVETMGPQPTLTEKQALSEIFGAMLGELNGQKRTIERVNGDLKEFYANVSGYRTAFDTAQQAASKDKNDIADQARGAGPRDRDAPGRGQGGRHQDDGVGHRARRQPVRAGRGDRLHHRHGRRGGAADRGRGGDHRRRAWRCGHGRLHQGAERPDGRDAEEDG